MNMPSIRIPCSSAPSAAARSSGVGSSKPDGGQTGDPDGTVPSFLFGKRECMRRGSRAIVARWRSLRAAVDSPAGGKRSPEHGAMKRAGCRPRGGGARPERDRPGRLPTASSRPDWLAAESKLGSPARARQRTLAPAAPFGRRRRPPSKLPRRSATNQRPWRELTSRRKRANERLGWRRFRHRPPCEVVAPVCNRRVHRYRALRALARYRAFGPCWRRQLPSLCLWCSRPSRVEPQPKGPRQVNRSHFAGEHSTATQRGRVLAIEPACSIGRWCRPGQP